MSVFTPEQIIQQDKQYIQQVAGEFVDDATTLESNYYYYDNIMPNDEGEITITNNASPIIDIIKHCFVLNSSNVFYIVCDHQTMFDFFKTLTTREKINDLKLNSLWSFKIIVTPTSIEIDVPNVMQTSFRLVDLDYTKTKLKIPITFYFTCNAYSINNYLETKKIKFGLKEYLGLKDPNDTLDTPLTLWGIFTSLLRGYVLFNPENGNGLTGNFFLVNANVESWMTCICLYLPSLFLKREKIFYLNISQFLPYESHPGNQHEALVNFFNYLYFVYDTVKFSTVQNKLLDIIKQQLGKIRSFFDNKGKIMLDYRMIFKKEASGNKIIVVPNESTNPFSKNRMSPDSIPIFTIKKGEIKYYAGMCDPTTSLEKISQHCEHLYYGRINNTGKRDRYNLCASKIAKAATTPTKTYLSNCTNFELTSKVAKSGGKNKRRRRKTNKKTRRNKRKTIKQKIYT
jgi:hypothetical protein